MKKMSFGCCYLCPPSLSLQVSVLHFHRFLSVPASMYDYQSIARRGRAMISVSVTLLIDDHLLQCIGLG